MFYGIQEALEKAGCRVHVPALSGAHDNETRGEQLLVQIERFLKRTGFTTVNLFGHSQGALTARYAAAKRPDLVASITSISGPNHGSEVADRLRQAFEPGALPEQVAATLVQGFSQFLAMLSGNRALPQDPVAALDALTTAGVGAFNAQYPQGLPVNWGESGPEWVDGVGYYSWSGCIKGNLLDEGLNALDPLHLACRSYALLFEKEREFNDGLVGRFSSHLGLVIRSDYPMDHVDTINQTAGVTRTDPDPVALYIDHAMRLARKGL
jgi:triacylglycerol lipase